MDKETQKDILKWVLGSAFRAENHKNQLKERLAKIRAEMEAPMGTVKYNPMPRSKDVRDGAAEYMLKLSEIEEKIMEQIGLVSEAKMQVMKIIEFIPIHEPSRQIMELRHIDMKNWYQISEQLFMSRQQCDRLYREALEALLEYGEVRKAVKAAEKDYMVWRARRPERSRKKSSGASRPEKQSGKNKVGT